MADSAFFSPLSHEGILAVRGSDAGKFLQGQLTCNINYLSQEHASLGARCMVKGRMQSSFRIVPEGNGYLLAMASELLDAQLADLKKYAVFSKATLSDESAAWARFGLQGGEAALQALGLTPPVEAGATVRHEGLIAIAVSLITLAIMLFTILRDGSSAFFQAKLSFPMELSAEVQQAALREFAEEFGATPTGLFDRAVNGLNPVVRGEVRVRAGEVVAMVCVSTSTQGPHRKSLMTWGSLTSSTWLATCCCSSGCRVRRWSASRSRATTWGAC